MNDSSDPVETSSTLTPETGSARRPRATPRSVRYHRGSSLAPGTVELAPIGERRRGTEGYYRPGADEAAPAEQGNRAQRGPARRTRATSPAERSPSARSGPGTAPRPPPALPGWKNRPDRAASWWATSTIVSRASPIAGLGHHVPRRPVRQEAAAEPQWPAAHVIGHPAAAATPSRTPTARCPRSAARPAAPPSRLSNPFGHQYVPWAVSFSITAVGPRRHQGLPDPLRGLVLARRGGGPVDRGEVAQVGLEGGEVGFHPTAEATG